MTQNQKSFLLNFLLMMLVVCLMFFIAVSMKAPAEEIVRYMNGNYKSKSLVDLFFFVGLVVIAAAGWSGLWVLFKIAEKKCVEIATK